MSKQKIKTIFIGTPDFGIPSLRALIKDKFFDVAAVITQSDKKKGRKQVLSPPPIKIEALKYNLKIWQPRQISDFKFPILNLDLIIVAAYAQILPKNILELPKHGCINVHASLLPKCRGAACIQAPIICGDKKTGVTIMKMDAGLDTGPILDQISIPIKNTDTTGSLFDKLSILGAKILIPALKEYISGKIKPRPQNEARKTYVRALKKEDGRIDWNKPAEEIERFVRAMAPWPGAFSNFRLISIKIIETEYYVLAINDYKIGEIFTRNKRLAVQCGKNALIMKKIQPEGKKPMTGKEFINGYGHLIGSVLE